MPTTFQISGPNFNVSTWRSTLRDLIRGAEGWEALPVMRSNFSKQDERNIDLGNAPVELPEIHCFMTGGIRGVRISQNNDSVKIKLLQLGSRGDWSFAYRLLWAGVDAGGTVNDDKGNSLTQEQMTAEAIALRFPTAWAEDMSALQRAVQTQDPVPVPVAGYSLLVSGNDLRLSGDALEEALTIRADRYARAFIPPVSTENTPDGRSLQAISHASIPSLIAKSAPYVKITELAGKPFIPLQHFITELSPQVEDAGNFYYLPAVSFAGDSTLAQAMLRGALQQPTPSTAQSQRGGGGADDIPNHEFGILIRSPLVVFFLVAGADGKVDKKEVMKLLSLMQAAVEQGSHGTLFSAVLRSTVANLPVLMEEVAQVSPIEQLLELRLLVEQLFNPHDCYNFKKGLLSLGQSIAEASGGFLGIGSKVSKEEKLALTRIAQLLNFQP
jgi:hypothetical protein